MRLSPILFSSLLLTPALTITVNKAHAALTATTANTIQGTAPYIELNGVKATDLSSLLSIKIGSDTYISDASGHMSKIGVGGVLTPIQSGTALTLSAANDHFDSVGTIVPPNNTNHSLNNVTIIPLSARKDADGDGIFTVTGNMKGSWTDKNGIVITNLTDSATICNAPYTLTLSTSGTPSISTQYGDPDMTTYGNSSAKYIINPVSVPTICYAKPFSMHYSTGQYAGPVTMWDGGTTGGTGTQSNGKGFLTQSITPSTYGNNFPTTGLNGLYFDLDIAGVTGSLTWPTITIGDITATMSNITPTSVRVTLTGPVAVGLTATLPSVLPATFELTGNDSSGVTIVKYGFSIKKWYVDDKHGGGGTVSSANWCAGLDAGGGYVLSKISDLTTASGTVGNIGGTTVPILPYPNPSGNNYWRHIGGGLFSEWGDMRKYPSAGFRCVAYYTNEYFGSNAFGVYSTKGNVNLNHPGGNACAICTQP